MNRRKFIFNTSLITAGSATLTAFTNQQFDEPIKKPKGLIKGETIGLTAPAGCIWNKYHITKIQKVLKELGFKTVVGKTNYKQKGYLAGSDDMRANEFMEMIEDNSIRAILTMRGGWGCSRILDLLDYESISKHPKVIMGFSDITSLVNAIHTKTGLVTFHGPCGYSSWGDFTREYVINATVKGKPYKMINPPENNQDLEVLNSGAASGRLIGGNLTVLSTMVGTNYEPNWNNKILFLEEIKEEPYRVDRMLWQFKQSGVFEKVNGVVLGSFRKCTAEEPEKSFTLEEVFNQHFGAVDFPVYKGASFGHIGPKFTLPIGVKAEMQADSFILRTIEKSVIS